jgi:transcription initiation factor TFIIIB Brf1 subunit/transcription initiation factor TFIIB
VPIYRMKCPECDSRFRVLREKPPEDFRCKLCGAVCRRGAADPGVTSVEVLDNGMMARPVERHPEIRRLRDEAVRAIEDDARDEYRTTIPGAKK